MSRVLFKNLELVIDEEEAKTGEVEPVFEFEIASTDNIRTWIMCLWTSSH